VKYYKGLGTSTSQEAKEYFQKLDKHKIRFKYQGSQDNQLIDMVFNKNKAKERKTWLEEPRV
jgi:DNA topoisomerase II